MLPAAATNLQYEIDRAAQAVLDRISEAQAAAGSAAPGTVSFPLPPPSSSSSSGGGGSRIGTAASGDSGSGDGGEAQQQHLSLDISRPMLLPELRRHKRAFMKLATNQTWIRMPDAAAAQRLFVDYLRQQLL